MSGPHWRWPTGLTFKFHAGPVQTRVPGALTNEFGIMVRRRDSVAFVGRAGAGGRRSLPRLPAFHAAQTTGAPVLNGLDRVGNLNDLEGGFLVIGKPRPPPFSRGLVANCSRSARQDTQSGCWPDVRQAALRGLGAIRGLTSLASGVVLRLSASDTHRMREPGGRGGAVG